MKVEKTLQELVQPEDKAYEQINSSIPVIHRGEGKKHWEKDKTWAYYNTVLNIINELLKVFLPN